MKGLTLSTDLMVHLPRLFPSWSLPNAPAMMASFTRRSCLPEFLRLASQLPNVQQICHPQSSIGRIRGTLLFSASLRLSQPKQLEQRLYLHPQSRLEHQL